MWRASGVVGVGSDSELVGRVSEGAWKVSGDSEGERDREDLRGVWEDFREGG